MNNKRLFINEFDRIVLKEEKEKLIPSWNILGGLYSISREI